jgi:hypothetical protein
MPTAKPKRIKYYHQQQRETGNQHEKNTHILLTHNQTHITRAVSEIVQIFKSIKDCYFHIFIYFVVIGLHLIEVISHPYIHRN